MTLEEMLSGDHTVRIVRETIFSTDKHASKFYRFELPTALDGAHHRVMTSYNAFFNSTRLPLANWTNLRVFSANRLDDFKLTWNNVHKDPDLIVENFIVTSTLYTFFQLIGYDYKARTYITGEKMRTFI